MKCLQMKIVEITEISALKFELEQLKRENTFLKSKHDELSSKYQLSVLRLEHVVASDVNFKFYTSFPNYATFKPFLITCNQLVIF